MKKISVVAGLSLLAVTQCAAVIDLDVGAGVWQVKPSGTINVPNNPTIDLDASGVANSSTATYAYAKFEHPIPIIPNLRAEYVNPSFDGTVANFNFPNGPANVQASQTIDLKQIDAIAYWDLLGLVPIPWLTLNFGIDVKIFDGKYEATSPGVTPYSQSFNFAVPAGYLNPRVEIPMTGIGLEVSVKYIGGVVKSSMTDVMAKVDYTFNFIPVIQPGVEVGYRMQNLKLDSSDIGVSNFDMDVKSEGVYGGLFLHF